MKLLIIPYIEGIPTQLQTLPRFSFESIIDALKTASVQKSGQTLDLLEDQSVKNQVNSFLDNFDFDLLLDPTMPNTGGMEIMTTIKRQLRSQIESALFSQKN